MTACTVSQFPVCNVRGGKGFEARWAAYQARLAAHQAAYCGATDDRTVMLHSMGPARGRTTTARMGNGEAEAFAATCTMSNGTSYASRFIGRTDISWAAC